MKNIIKIVTLIALSAFLFVGCSDNKSYENSDTPQNSEKQSEGETKVINVWLPPIGENDEDVWKPIFEEFEKENNVKINLQIVPWDNYPETYLTAITAGTGPDVGYMYAEMFPQFINMGAVEDLTNYFTKEDLENNIYIEDSKMLGGMYGMPIEAANPAVLYYNKDILEELGEEPPKTWEDFRRIAKAATKDTDGDGKIDQWGFSQGWGKQFFGDLNWNWYGFLWQAGGELYSDDLKTVRFDDEHGMKAAKFLSDLIHVDKVVPDDTLSKDNKEMLLTVFGPGKSAFTIWLSSAASEILDKSFPDLNYGFVLSLEDEAMGTFASVDQLTLMSAAKDKDLSFKLIKHMLSKESMTKFHEHHPRAPISKDEPYQGDPRLKEIIETQKGVYRPLVVAPHGVEIYNNLWKHLQAMAAGNMTYEEALKKSAEYANELLKSGE